MGVGTIIVKKGDIIKEKSLIVVEERIKSIKHKENA